MDRETYRTRAEAFLTELTREHYRHFAGLQADLPLEAVYAGYGDLFTREAVEELRTAAGGETRGDEARRRRYLLEFAVEGFLGQATRDVEAELARREASLQIHVDGMAIGYREAAVAQATEADRQRRGALEDARNAAVADSLGPLYREAIETQHALARDLGWPSYRAMIEDVAALDLAALGRQTEGFLAATEAAYPSTMEPELRRVTGAGLADLRRADVPWFLRDAGADAAFPAERLVPSLRATLGGLGIDLDAQPNVVLDVDPRPTKSPRAFCAPVRVPDEVYLVLPPVGGVDDYVVLFHEAGHTEHYGNVDPALPFEYRCLGDNSVTEAFAFLFDHLIEDPGWLAAHLDAHDGAGRLAHARAQRLLYLRRYSAKLAYELELHAAPSLDRMADAYARRLGDALHIEWPRETFLADVDPGFYVAKYLRAWALETHMRAHLRERFGPAWWAEPEAGAALRALWAQGQRLDADELLGELTGASLDFGAMAGDLGI
ncbi:MAG: hypothetical protein JWN32_3685 [Solirubrobacterales bacterium]|nr:hypothetical protein [Solirubrobacterales bacterium]